MGVCRLQKSLKGKVTIQFFLSLFSSFPVPVDLRLDVKELTMGVCR